MPDAERKGMGPSCLERADQLVRADPGDEKGLVLSGGLDTLVARAREDQSPGGGTEPAPKDDEYEERRAHL